MQSETYSEQHSPDPRKRHATRRSGVYFRIRPDGTKQYLIGYRDSSGKQVWKNQDSFREAEAALDDVKSRMRRGERVVRSRVRFREFAEEWLETQTQLRDRTIDAYRSALRVHLYPRFGGMRVVNITEDDAARLIRDLLAAGYAASSILSTLRPLSRVLSHAARRGVVPVNVLTRLERGERPSQEARERRVLDAGEIADLLAAAPERYKLMLDVAVTTAIRQGELLGLQWADVDTAQGVLTVRMQLDRDGQRVAPKTKHARREIELPDSLVTALREHKAASPWSQPSDYVFASSTGGPMHYRNVARRGLEKAVEAAGLDDDGKPTLRWHDLRHTALSGLIADGIPLSTVARIAGHANTAVTGRVYAHEIEKAEQGDRAREAMERRRGNRRVTKGEKGQENETAELVPEVAQLSEIRTSRN